MKQINDEICRLCLRTEDSMVSFQNFNNEGENHNSFIEKVYKISSIKVNYCNEKILKFFFIT